jgi:putative colanic acid biosynthesis acetyltransferase WcaF
MKLISSPIILNDQCWVCARAFIGPGITVHDGAVVGAMSVVTKEIQAWTVYAGNPAHMIKKRCVVTDAKDPVDAEAAPDPGPSAAAGDRAA